ncbi:MAG: hypothetical protein R2861_03380 [Desulfobacterales bacterium]
MDPPAYYKKHSDFVTYPIVMDVEKDEFETDADGKQVLDKGGKPVKRAKKLKKKP